MLAKMTAKNQLTLPKTVTDAVGATDYFDVETRNGQIILTPVRIQRADAVRAKSGRVGTAHRLRRGSANRWAMPTLLGYGNKGKDMPQLRFIHQHDANWTAAHLALLRAVEIVIASGLEILGVSAPQEMR